MITIKVAGLAELQKALHDLPKELQRGPLRSAVSAAAKVVQDQAVANVRSNPSVDSGDLARAIYRTRSRSGSSSEVETHIIGVRSGRTRADRKKGIGAFYWSYIEFGTRYIVAEPFLRPAFDNSKEKIIEKLVERLSKAIDRAAAKVRGN